MVNSGCGFQDVDKYKSFSMLPRDISQQIFSELFFSHCLAKDSLKGFRDYALQDILLGDYPRVKIARTSKILSVKLLNFIF